MASSVGAGMMFSAMGPRTVADRTDGGSVTEVDGSSSQLDNSRLCTARLAQLLDSGKFSDVTLVVGSRRYCCHRLLLANASSVLE